jgi:hypothetical protein
VAGIAFKNAGHYGRKVQSCQGDSQAANRASESFVRTIELDERSWIQIQDYLKNILLTGDDMECEGGLSASSHHPAQLPNP